MVRRVSILLLGLAAAVVVCGCGGGGGGGAGGGGGVTPGVTLIVGADTVYGTSAPTAKLSAAGATTLHAPLDDGAQVVVYNFRDGSVVKTGTITSGWCELTNIPAGLSLAIVVTGKRAGKDYRLSTLVPVVTDTQAEYVANPVTSIAAEAFSIQHLAKNKVFSEADLQPVIQKAQEYVQAHPSADYSVGGGVFTNAGFAKSNSLNTSDQGVQEVVNSVGSVNDKLARAKNTLTLIEEAGTPLREMLDPESLDFQGVFTEQVLNKYQSLAENLGKLLAPAAFTELKLGSGQEINISQLTVGHKYTVTGTTPEGHLVLRDDGAGTAGVIVIRRTTGDGVYSLVGKQSGSSWELTQTFTGDAQQQYKLTIPNTVLQDEQPGANPRLTCTLSARDSTFTTPVVLSVTASATGQDPDTYTALTFSGSLSIPEVSISGTMSAQFPASKPTGAAQDQTRYDFPTSFEMTNGRINVKVGSKQITLQGNISAQTQFVRLSDGVTTVPGRVLFTGGYSNTHTGLTFTGSINFNGSWVAKNDSAKPSTGNIKISGSLEKSGHPTYGIDLTMSKTADKVTSTFTINSGVISFEGSGTGSINAQTDEMTAASVTITASTGVVISYNRDISRRETGQMTVDGTKVATLTFPQNAIRVTFTDGTAKQFTF